MTEASTPGMNRSSAESSGVKDELASDAKRLKDTAQQRVEQQANARKGHATRAAHAASSALEKAASELRNDDSAPSWLSSAFEKTAREIDQLAGGIEGKDVREIRRNVTDFARQSPAAFIAASAAAGFAAARFLRAGNEYQSHHPDGGTGSGQTSGQQVGAASSGTWNERPLEAASREGATL